MAEYESLTAAVAANNLMKVEELLGDLEQTTQEKNAKNTFLNARKSICMQALTNKNLPLLKLAFKDEIFLQSTAFDKEANVELVNAAIESDFVDGVGFLQTRGLALEYVDRVPVWSTLLESGRKDKLEILKFVLAIPYLDVSVCKEETVLMNACSRRSAGTVSLLLQNSRVKAVVNTPSSANGDVALHRCFDGDGKPEENCLACVKALVDAGADVNLPAKSSGKTPHAMAVAAGLGQVANYLKQHGAK